MTPRDYALEIVSLAAQADEIISQMRAIKEAINRNEEAIHRLHGSWHATIDGQRRLWHYAVTLIEKPSVADQKSVEELARSAWAVLLK
ncbi:hypothetical protein [Xanthobacter oligotrophicus]|uniref:hypothetical protein n=1 Tax=Xanthobacter oligotrophicus TaxID=2607286 RepID=UPI0011F3E7E6|nr:hypothetical protein [Xanthobacter oligotrophicus]MCG5237120.1 hypothetical protein [Xanthobacter oligotrophicus]